MAPQSDITTAIEMAWMLKPPTANPSVTALGIIEGVKSGSEVGNSVGVAVGDIGIRVETAVGDKVGFTTGIKEGRFEFEGLEDGEIEKQRDGIAVG